MIDKSILKDPAAFSEILFEKMKQVNPGVAEMELYEFRYGLDNLVPEQGGWASVSLDAMGDIEQRIESSDFYAGIQIKPRQGDKIVLDPQIVRLTNMLFAGLALGDYPVDWVKAHFYFDIRGFYFLHRMNYFTPQVLQHLGGRPFRCFEQKQACFARFQDLGYKDFQAANAEVDEAFMASVEKLVEARGTPVILAIAGGTAAGKTEIVARLRSRLQQAGKIVSTVEMDNFLTDRDEREQKGLDSHGKFAIHFERFVDSLTALKQGRKVVTPRYDFIDGSSSHDLDGNLKPGRKPVEIEPADIIFIEGNFPFLLAEIVPLIDIKVVYLTDDDVRMKRKWKRDIDYRKKYEPTYFRNRYFRDQFFMAHKCLFPQMEACDILVDTSGAALWVTAEIAKILS
jgi:uridine kinase